MARHERDFQADADRPLSMDELLVLLDENSEGRRATREDAIACYLSGDEGWRDAVKLLGGTFAGGAPGLTERKGD